MDILSFTTVDDWLIPFLIVLTIIVFVHEWGHYWIARRNGVRVEVFSIGFGPELFGWNDKHGTRWKVSALPLGGYVKMFGMVEDDDSAERAEQPLTAEETAVSFAHKRVGQRAAIVFGGPAANFLFAMVMLAGIAMTAGIPKIDVTVSEVMPNSAAAMAGMQSGDIIKTLNGGKIENSRDVQKIVSANPGTALPMVVSRDGADKNLDVTPKTDVGPDGNKRGLLGIKMQGAISEFERLNPFAALWYGVTYTASLTGDALSNLAGLFVGKGNFKDLGGPIAIADFSGKAAAGGILDLVFFMAVLSVNLGLINLFPIPILDGGHLVFMGFEAARGRPLGPRTQEYGFRIGLILVLILMIAVTWNDLERKGFFKFLQNLVT